MADSQKYLLQGSQQSNSELSDPPDITDEDMGEILVKPVTPPTPIHHSQESDIDDNMASQHKNSRKPTSHTKQSTRNAHHVDPCVSKDEISAEISVSSKASKKRVPAKRSNVNNNNNTKANTTNQPAKKAKRTARPKNSKWDPKYVTENERSPLVNVDLRVYLILTPHLSTLFTNISPQSLLLQPAAWDCLTPEDKKEILELFPDGTPIIDAGTRDARPDFQSLRNDDNFRHDCDQYVSNLANGVHDPQWLKDAWAAHENRTAGKFDAFYIRRLEIDWDTTIPDEYKPEHLRSNKNGDTFTSSGHTPGDREIEIQGAAEDAGSQKATVGAETNGYVGEEEVIDIIPLVDSTIKPTDPMAVEDKFIAAESIVTRMEEAPAVNNDVKPAKVPGDITLEEALARADNGCNGNSLTE